VPTACVKLHVTLHYCKDAFEAGLKKHGYDIINAPSPSPSSDDILVLWNRYTRDEAHAVRYEKAQATVLIAENSWLGPEDKDKHHFAICKGHHNGAGTWHVGGSERWLPIELKPWRTDGDHIMVLPQRGMGEPGVRQERSWLPGVLNRLQGLTRRPIVVHHHPGPRPHPPIDFKDTWACVTWASGAGIKAIVEGIPVFHEFPQWIGAPAARLGLDDLENPYYGDRQRMLHRLAWATWSADEIRKGEPFKWLLSG
jgi:hypothetical protein